MNRFLRFKIKLGERFADLTSDLAFHFFMNDFKSLEERVAFLEGENGELKFRAELYEKIKKWVIDELTMVK